MRSFTALRSNTARQLSIAGLKSCEHPPALATTAALCAIAVGGCAPAYTKTNIALPPDRHTTGSIRPEKREIRVTRVAPASTVVPVKMAVPLPREDLLNPVQEPHCEFPATETADERQKLDYERQCYRQAEIIARTRLQLLQNSIEKTVKAIKNSD
jgi:hypothetical protein